MERFIIELEEIMGKMFSIHEIVSKQPRDYGCGIEIYPADIHLIEVIGKYKDSNTTQIANILGVTKGTVSNATKRLEEKGFIKKYQYVDNKKEIYYKLTDLGEKAFQGHYKYHELKSKEVYSELNNYTDEEKRIIVNFVRRYTEQLSQYVD